MENYSQKDCHVETKTTRMRNLYKQVDEYFDENDILPVERSKSKDFSLLAAIKN